VTSTISDNANLRGAGWMTLAMAGYVLNDTFIKLAADDMPLFQAVFLRGLFVSAVLTIATMRRGELALLRTRLSRPMVVRFAMETIGTVFFLLALTNLPLAGITAVMQIVPIAVTFAAARLLRERVSVHRVAAVVVGFGGVLLILRPWSDSFSPWFLAGLVAVGLVVIRELATRGIPDDVPSLVIALGTALCITALGLGVSVFEGWAPLGMRDVGVLALAGAFLTVGYIASVVTVRTGDLSFSAPFRYTVMLFAIVLQIVVFGEVPDLLTFVGSAVIVGAGIWSFSRERAVSRKPRLNRWT
jgi:drug/metabolite transporter (DMT)-like permease